MDRLELGSFVQTSLNRHVFYDGLYKTSGSILKKLSFHEGRYGSCDLPPRSESIQQQLGGSFLEGILKGSRSYREWSPVICETIKVGNFERGQSS